MAQFLSESTADGKRFYLVENDEAARLLRAATDLECGAPEEVDYWGGWEYNADPWDELDDEVPEDVDIDSLIEKVLEAGGKVGTEDALRAVLVSKTDSAFQFDVSDIVSNIVWENY